MTRRFFLYTSAIILSLATFCKRAAFSTETTHKDQSDTLLPQNEASASSSTEKSDVYAVKNGSAYDNTVKMLEMLGGIDSLVDPTDIVLLKPNGQWWNQGTTNTDSMRAFIEAVLAIPGFSGEVIVAENQHFPEPNSRGWTTDQRNGEFNLNELVQFFQDNGHPNVTKYHWHDGGTSTPGMWGGAQKGGLVKDPADGDGYIWRDDLVYHSPTGRKAMMSYPMFTSAYSGITIDFKNGPWLDGEFHPHKLKFINFSACNTHGGDTGITASIKNYLGICDMTCGFRGLEPEGYHNFHFVGHKNLHWRLKEFLSKFGWKDSAAAMGACVGYFMNNVRAADFNIVTAEWTGYGSRTDTTLRQHTKTILGSKDPVALDYITGKDVILPATLANTNDERLLMLHDPNRDDSPFRKFLLACHSQGIGNIEPKNMNVLWKNLSS